MHLVSHAAMDCHSQMLQLRRAQTCAYGGKLKVCFIVHPLLPFVFLEGRETTK